MAIAFVDVHYEGMGARAACVVVESWEAESPESTYVADIETVKPYEPGKFYLRELPGLVAVLGLLPSLPETVVVDGYVWLSVGRPGLGAHLYESLGRRAAIVGIAKTAFAGIESWPGVVPVLRGTSRSPLFVSAAGMEPEEAANNVRRMAGESRIPEIVKMTDQLSRSGARRKV